MDLPSPVLICITCEARPVGARASSQPSSRRTARSWMLCGLSSTALPSTAPSSASSAAACCAERRLKLSPDLRIVKKAKTRPRSAGTSARTWGVQARQGRSGAASAVVPRTSASRSAPGTRYVRRFVTYSRSQSSSCSSRRGRSTLRGCCGRPATWRNASISPTATAAGFWTTSSFQTIVSMSLKWTISATMTFATRSSPASSVTSPRSSRSPSL
mmetsp:Transcript_2724/g.9649  ORF Transcript_2724/g.9649 Transcript_2724/m.9649 type:complete len:215 (-) Transcript_2724:1068-1712(-)